MGRAEDIKCKRKRSFIILAPSNEPDTIRSEAKEDEKSQETPSAATVCPNRWQMVLTGITVLGQDNSSSFTINNKASIDTSIATHHR